MKTMATVIVLLAGVVIGVCLRPYVGQIWRAVTNTSNSPPRPLTPEMWASKTGQFQILDGLEAEPALVYLGDSTTDWMSVGEFIRFEGGRVLNRGICGDTTAGACERVQKSFPKGALVCFVLLGHNDLAHGSTPRQTADGVGRLLDLLLDNHQVPHVVVESLLPDRERSHMGIEELNRLLAGIVDRRDRTSYIDLYSNFMKDGQQDVSLFVDHGHLNEQGVLRRLHLEMEHLTGVAPDVRRRVTSIAEGAGPPSRKPS